jgi:two-component system, NtrC family, sensor histidine kinase GlrK
MPPLRLSTRLGLTHGVLAALLLILLVVTLQGLVRMLGLITEIHDERFASVDTEEELHRSAWALEVAVRHGKTACARGGDEADIRARIDSARGVLRDAMARRVDGPEALRSASQRYLTLADGAFTGGTCAYLRAPATDAFRAALDEEITTVWIDRLHELHSEIQAREAAARHIGIVTAITGLMVALAGAVAASVIARSTARSVTAPIAQLARDATRVGEGDFGPIPAPQGPLEVQELWRDLDLMRTRLAELEKLKNGFLANVSHELRSPLTRVREGLSLLADGTCGPLSDRQERVVKVASRACEREVRIVTALLDMSRLRSGLPLKVEAGCDIDRVIDAVVQEERADAAERGVLVEVEADGAVPAMEIDSALVERALANLVRNAVSVSERGQHVRVYRRAVDGTGDGDDEQGRRVRVEVADDGPGLPAEVIASNFKAFSASAVGGIGGNGRPAGIGLGLSFAREVARAHQGELSVLRSDDTGTTFCFEILLEPAAESTRVPS